MSRTVFQIESGLFALTLVDTGASGYASTWQAPGGATLATVDIDDYAAGAETGWSCQIIDAALTATPDTTTTDVPATWCAPAETIPTPGLTSYEITGSFLQDPDVVDGLNQFLFEHDTEEAYVYMSLNGGDPPTVIGRVRVAAATIGGAARTNLTADLSLPLTGKPDIRFGNSTTSDDVTGEQGAPSEGATAGTPGTWTPSGSTPPTSPAALISDDPVEVTASPGTAWTTGQYVQTQTASTPGRAYWNGTTWVAGTAP